MTAGQILRTLRAIPFAPFAIHLADRREIGIRHPELVVLTAGGLIAMIRNADGLLEAVDVLLIVSLRPLPAVEAKPRR